MSFTVIIPARFASERLPGKPLLTIAGKPMIQQVYDRAQQSQAKQVIVATDDERIVTTVKHFGGEVCLTDASHCSGTDRIQQVVHMYGLADDEIVVNVQGDEPLLPPAVINQVAKNLHQRTEASVATLYEPILSMDDFINPNIVKVLADFQGFAHYFSRSPVPYVRDGLDTVFQSQHQSSSKQLSTSQQAVALRHIGLYAYRVALLHQFVQWPMAPLEQLEKLEQLRILYHGHRIHIAQACETVPHGVDTPEDLALVQQYIERFL